MKIQWTETAINHLKSIYEYYKLEVSISVASSVRYRIIEHSKILAHQLLIGTKEELLLHLAKEYRYLVEGNYKILYTFQENKVIIAAIFDTRQEPKKLQESIKS